MTLNRCQIGDCRETLRTLPAGTFSCCVTSPPYWGLRDYGHADQLGLERTPEEYVANMVGVFAEVKRVLADDGTLWLNIGDSYAATTKGSSGKGEKQITNAGAILADRSSRIPDGLKAKDLVGIPWRLAFALQADGWYLRSDIIWAKPNPMPESVTDRPTKAHEYLFLLAKSDRYFYDADAIREKHVSLDEDGNHIWTGKPASQLGTAPHKEAGRKYSGDDVDPIKGAAGLRSMGYNPLGRNKRTVWTIASQPYSGSHFATMPPALVTPCILAGSPAGGAVLDPFFGSGTVGEVAESLGRRWFGCELNPEYGKLIAQRTAQTGLMFGGGK